MTMAATASTSSGAEAGAGAGAGAAHWGDGKQEEGSAVAGERAVAEGEGVVWT